MTKTIRKNLITVLAVIALSFTAITPAFAAGEEISPYGPYGHNPEPTAIVGLEDTVALASVGSFTLGLVFIGYASTLKELIANKLA